MYQFEDLIISNYYKEYIDRDIREFRLRCNIATPSNISSIKIDHDLLLGSEDYTIGNLAVAKLSMVVSSNVIVNEGDLITIDVELKAINSRQEEIWIEVPLGRFHVFNVSHTQLSKTIEAYDDLYKPELDREYKSNYVYDKYSSDISAYVVLEEICDSIGIICPSGLAGMQKLPRPKFVPVIVLDESGNQVVVESDSNQVCFGMTMREALSYIAGYLGGNFFLDGERRLQLAKLNTKASDVVKIYEPNKYAPPTQGDAVYKVDTIHCTMSDGELVSIGEMSNAALVLENPFYDVDTLKNTLLPTMSKISYSPVKVKLRGDPTIQLGDTIALRQLNSNEITIVPVLRLRLSYTGGCGMEIESVCRAVSEKDVNYKGTVTSRLEVLENRVTKTNKEIDEVKQSLETLKTVKNDMENMDALLGGISNAVSLSKLNQYNLLLDQIERNERLFNSQYTLVVNHKYLT
jgi:hypothetical protein